jgi:hypothetical protein
VERNAAKAASVGQVLADGVHRRSGAAAKRSEVQRTETDGVRHLDVSRERSASDAVLASGAWPVSRLRCAGNGVERS